ncbi:MAG: hypothetical protein R3282_05285, partial [Rhodothermales bacterium]|nr:hypothetical protein [Rhodothermales bacterium]
MRNAHAIVICLNCYLGPTRTRRILAAHDRRGNARREFLERRIPLMCRYTLTSLLGQTNERFSVLLLHDRRLAIDDLLDVPEVRAFSRRLRVVGIEPIDFRQDVENAFWRPRPAEDSALKEIVGREVERLLITYLDSDDS